MVFQGLRGRVYADCTGFSLGDLSELCAGFTRVFRFEVLLLPSVFRGLGFGCLGVQGLQGLRVLLRLELRDPWVGPLLVQSN